AYPDLPRFQSAFLGRFPPELSEAWARAFRPRTFSLRPAPSALRLSVPARLRVRSPQTYGLTHCIGFGLANYSGRRQGLADHCHPGVARGRAEDAEGS